MNIVEGSFALQPDAHCVVSSLLNPRLGDLYFALENTAAVKAIMDESITLGEYVRILHGLRPLHAAYELRFCDWPFVLSVPYLHRREDIDVDITAWNPQVDLNQFRPCPEILAMTTHALIGAIYIFEGLRLLSRVLQRHLIGKFSYSGSEVDGLLYHRGDQLKHWFACREAMDQLNLSAAERMEVIRGAQVASRLICQVYQG